MKTFSRLKKLLIYARYFYLIFQIFKLRKSIVESDECVVIGNGPSLNDSLTMDINFIKSKKLFCVNNFVNSEYFTKLKPDFYVLTDSNYWDKDVYAISQDIKKGDVGKYSKITIDYFKVVMESHNDFFSNIINKTKWELNLFVPLQSKPTGIFDKLAKENDHIKIIYYSMIPFNFKFSFIRHFLYRLNVCMPTAQTVLHAATFLALNLNFKKIYLIGVDHSWHEDLVLDKNNIIYTKDKHFYDQDKQKMTPFVFDIKTGSTPKMYEVFFELHIMFKSYLFLDKYAKSIGAKIYNSSKKTFVDAFERYDNTI